MRISFAKYVLEELVSEVRSLAAFFFQSGKCDILKEDLEKKKVCLTLFANCKYVHWAFFAVHVSPKQSLYQLYKLLFANYETDVHVDVSVHSWIGLEQIT